MFNYKTEMIENTKTEKWDSLRLDLQEFAPQEFVAACWIPNVFCSGDIYISVDKKTVHSHSGNGHTIDVFIKQDTRPTSAQINMIYTSEGITIYAGAGTGATEGHAKNKNWNSEAYAWKDGNEYHYTLSNPYNWIPSSTHS